eukprot:6762968-Prymnesium_polylepis.1
MSAHGDGPTHPVDLRQTAGRTAQAICARAATAGTHHSLQPLRPRLKSRRRRRPRRARAGARPHVTPPAYEPHVTCGDGLATLLQARGLCATKCRTPIEWRESPQGKVVLQLDELEFAPRREPTAR